MTVAADPSQAPDRPYRTVVDKLRPEIDGGRCPIKRIVGDRLTVTVNLLADGHDRVDGMLLFHRAGESTWRETPLVSMEGDRWRGECLLDNVGRWQYTVEGWVDAFASWLWSLRRKQEAAQDVSIELLDGARLVSAAATRATGDDAKALAKVALALAGDRPADERIAIGLDPTLATLMRRYPDRSAGARYPQVLEVIVDPPRARFSTWYELFPRSCGAEGRHGTLRDVEALLPDVAAMGFDVLYLPPIHPIGASFRKGPNNAEVAGPNDPGSPWAIGGPAGGHKAIHPELGTLADFRSLVAQARKSNIEVALDIALQVSPDHPYLREHPEWFAARADGSMQYAENPPKKYQDIYPFDFTCADWRALWEELRSIFVFWVEQGVRVFRVDNPHTKPLPFWRWCLDALKREYPELIFLAEAFTRPTVMNALAKVGFSQSYTYFTWRTTKGEIAQYFQSLVSGAVGEEVEYFRPNLWPSTPDILPEHLQFGTRATFIARLVLAGTLSSSYGIYGPPFELMERTARPDAEEYLDSEKYQIRKWDRDRKDSLRPVIRRLNQIRREVPALQGNEALHFHAADNESILCYSKQSRDGASVVLVVVNLDPHHLHTAWLDLDLAVLGLGQNEPFQAHDLLSDARYVWHGTRNFVSIDPNVMPAHIFAIRRHVRSERSFEYYL